MTEYFFILFGTSLVRVSSWQLPKTGPKEVGIFTVPLTKALLLSLGTAEWQPTTSKMG